jgi:hypothetical protein
MAVRTSRRIAGLRVRKLRRLSMLLPLLPPTVFIYEPRFTNTEYNLLNYADLISCGGLANLFSLFIYLSSLIVNPGSLML